MQTKQNNEHIESTGKIIHPRILTLSWEAKEFSRRTSFFTERRPVTISDAERFADADESQERVFNALPARQKSSKHIRQ